MFLDPNCEIRDLDIAIHTSEKDIESVKKHLVDSGYKPISQDRQYFLTIIDPVTIIDIQNNEWRLDIAFLGGPLERKMNLVLPSAYHTTMDKFDIHSVFWRFPELDCIDLYGAFEALRNKTMRPLYSLYEENPYLLINHVINMCAKYDMSLSKNSTHKKIIEVLLERINHWSYSDKFHQDTVRIAHYSTIFKALNRSKNKEKFIKDLVLSDILLHTIPELQQILKGLSPEQIIILSKTNSKQEIVEFLLSIASSKKVDLSKYLQLLNLRKWDLEDREIKSKSKYKVTDISTKPKILFQI